MTSFDVAEVPSLNWRLGSAIANLGGVISKVQCCDMGNFSRTWETSLGNFSRTRLYGK